MTTKRIIYSRPDGGVTVVCPSPRYIAELMASVDNLTEDEAIALVQAKDVPLDATNVEVIELSVVPQSREFRNAWEKLAPGPPTINMAKARGIHTKRINDTADFAGVKDLDLVVINAQIAVAPNPTSLSAIWPVELQEFKVG